MKRNYIGAKFISDHCTKIFQRRMKGIDPDIQIFTKSGPTLAGMFKRKPNRETVRGVYAIPCLDCEAVYVGQTMQGLKKRIQQHRYVIRTGCATSAMLNHAHKNSHSIGFEDAAMLVGEKYANPKG